MPHVLANEFTTCKGCVTNLPLIWVIRYLGTPETGSSESKINGFLTVVAFITPHLLFRKLQKPYAG
jgi:hypothetical protein